ncbi:MAG: PD40 domain-containing protein [Ignavibacteriae bacterium]|nr:PD40 domain-containing protein [Ignavibacteriota bacterium]MCB9214965.1 PD40 domain-containing protein [Ignavibacteria bacterium]
MSTTRPLLFLWLIALLPFSSQGCGSSEGVSKRDPVNQFTVIKAPIYQFPSSAKVSVQNLGYPMNTAKDEYGPQFGPNGVWFYLSRGGNNTFDIYRSEVGSFTSPNFQIPLERFSPPDRRIGGITFAGDGSRVVFVACNLTDGKGSCDLYEIEGYGTATATSVNIDATNSVSWESSPVLSYDGNTLYFTSNAGSIPNSGGLEAHLAERDDSDIMVSKASEKGTWGIPIRLNSAINSGSNEDTPFILQGDSILYFCSDRPGGYGGKDLYVSFKKGDGSWGDPLNLGYPINTEADERSFIVTPDGKGMYFASNRGGDTTKGKYDIYSVQLTTP